jgi:ligand-binding sensor domain-containing protein/two-component sensor histidine kinase
MRKILFFIYLLFIFCNSSFAQTYPFRIYSIEEGLSESVVNDLIQDREGYIWLATGFGLNRFDGLEFEQFFEDNGLSSSQTNTVFEDSYGRIWVGTIHGAQYIVGDSAYSYPNLKRLEYQSVISIFEDSQGGLWFGTESHGVWYYSKNSKLKNYNINNGLSGNEVRDITQTQNGTLWFATRDGLTQFKNGIFSSFHSTDGLPENRIRALAPDPKNEHVLWIGSRNGLTKYDGNVFKNFSTKEGLIDPRIRDLTWQDNGDLWLATEGGLSRFRNNEFINYTTKEGLSSDIIYSAITDREGNIWLGTLGGGANLFLGAFFENFNTNTGLANNLVTSITEDSKGNIWVGSYGGGLATLKEEDFTFNSSLQGLPDSRIYTLYADSKDRIWIGMRDGLSYLKDGKLLNLKEENFPFRKVRGVMEATNGDIWVSTYDEGLIQLTGDTLKQFTTDNGLPSNTVIKTMQTDDAAIWIATYGGVVKMSKDTLQVFGLDQGIPNVGVMDMILDNKGILWISTFGGIAWFDGTQFVDITYKNGLPGRVCYFIEQDKEGIYWIGTNAGVARLDFDNYYSTNSVNKDQAIQILQQEQGLIANETNLGAVYEDTKGNLWFGTIDGISKFKPSEYRGNQVEPIVKLTAFTASGRTYDLNKIELKHDRDFIEISFVALNLTAPNLIDYKYRITGIDPTWQFTRDRIAKYPSLPPGTYTFEVQARNSSGIWSKNTAQVNFVLHPPYWLTWWFIGFLLIIVTGIIFLIYRNYKASKLIDIERMRVRIASDLHDDVGASLTEVALQSDFLQASSMDSEFKKSLMHIGQQCRKIVTALDDIVWSIDARNDTLGDLTDRMQDYILNVLEPLNFDVNYNFEQLKMENHIPVPVKENLYLIFKEAVNNISKYSKGNKVHITMYSDNSNFKFTIHDNGVSHNSLKKTGHGLRNMQMRAQKMHGRVDISNKDGFKITLTGKLTMN